MQQESILCLCYILTVTVTNHSLECLYSIEMFNAKNLELGLNSGPRAVINIIILGIKIYASNVTQD